MVPEVLDPDVERARDLDGARVAGIGGPGLVHIDEALGEARLGGEIGDG